LPVGARSERAAAGGPAGALAHDASRNRLARKMASLDMMELSLQTDDASSFKLQASSFKLQGLTHAACSL
jgi:hypothetical protein